MFAGPKRGLNARPTWRSHLTCFNEMVASAAIFISKLLKPIPMLTDSFPNHPLPYLRLNRKAQEQLETLLLEGLNSPASELTDKDWGDIRQEAMAALEARRKAR